MGSDKARNSYDPAQQYRDVVMQQGRVFLEADWNEQQAIREDETIAELRDIIGSCGTPDDGYAVGFNNLSPNALPNEFSIGAGTMYVGGVRAFLPEGITFHAQPDWIDQALIGDPLLGSKTGSSRVTELICLLLREQEVSAVEDPDLKDVALGGPDTAQRKRLIQRVLRFPTQATDCAGAWDEAEKLWLERGFRFQSETMRLMPLATLQVGFVDSGTPPDPCEPAASGGYLEADNQLIRVKIVDNDTLVWGYDNASFLYRVEIGADRKTLTLQSRPVDVFHHPRKAQAVEVLPAAALLANGEYVAEADGIVTALNGAYDPDTNTVMLTTALPAGYQTGAALPPVFLRVWQETVSFTPGKPVALGDTGLQVTVGSSGAVAAGDCWMFAARPSTPQKIYLDRSLADFQPPDEPRLWICPLAVILWRGGRKPQIVDCRNRFDNLVELSKRRGSGCCTVVVRPQDVTGNNSLQAIVNSYKSTNERPPHVAICLMPGTYDLPAPLRLGEEHRNLTIEGCPGGVVLRAAAGAEAAFHDGLIVLNQTRNVILRDLELQLPLGAFPNQLVTRFAAANASLRNEVAAAYRFSIGLRPVDCEGLTVRNCRFVYPATQNFVIIGIGIFLAGGCEDLNVEDNRFTVSPTDRTSGGNSPTTPTIGTVPSTGTVPSGTNLAVRRNPHLLFGVLHLPSFLPTRASSPTVAPLPPALVRSQLNAARVRANQFADLTFATLIMADAGAVTWSDNTVTGSHAGCWLLSLRSLDAVAQIPGAATPSSAAELLKEFQTLVREWGLTDLQAVLMPLAFPLPPEATARTSTPLVPSTPVSQPVPSATFLPALTFTLSDSSRVLRTATVSGSSLFTNAAATAPANATSQPITAAPIVVEAAPIFLGEWERFHAPLRDALRAVLAEVGGTIALAQNFSLAVEMAHNQISCRVPNASSGIAVLIVDTDQQTQSTAILSANNIQSDGIATAMVLFVERCAITGCLIVNENVAHKPSGLSLVARGISSDVPPMFAITGNVLYGRSVLPPRPGSLPPPINTWDVFNAEF